LCGELVKDGSWCTPLFLAGEKCSQLIISHYGMRLSTPQLLARDLAGADPLEALLMELLTDSGSVWQLRDCDVRLVVCRCHAVSQRSIDSRGV